LREQLTQYGRQSSRAITDQYLDWLLYVAVSAARPSAKTAGDILYNLPAVRTGYMRGTGYFEYGRTRSRLIDDGVVLALVPVTTSPDQRKDDLAEIADEQRKNQGRSFDHMVVVEYRLDMAGSGAALLRLPDIAYADLFSAAYGYQEAKVGSAAELQQFLGSIDDLTRAARDNGTLVLGGRKLQGRPFRGIQLEHVATIWQAQQKAAEIERQLDAQVDRRRDELNAALHRHEISLSTAEAQLKEYGRRIYTGAHENGLVRHTGFSLDPTHDFDTLAQKAPPVLTALKAKLQLGQPDVDRVMDGIKQRDIVPLLKLQKHIEESPDSRLLPADRMALGALEERARFQAARYDGDIKGTEVGMVLFYTDLLAKIWAINFERDGPAIDGFVDLVHNVKPAIYEQESIELPSARLWFGTNDAGFLVASAGQDVLFARCATRIYSAGSNPLEPGKEVQTSASLAAPIDWWNDHYLEVAAYEQEYNRLNEIMKWSIVFRWLGDSGDTGPLSGLRDVTVRRNLRLPTWARTQPDLRFRQWDAVQFLPPGYRGTSTEAMPILYASNAMFSGGVSLADNTLLKGRVAAGHFDSLLRSSNVDYAASMGDRIVTFDKIAFGRVIGTDARAIMSVAPKEGMKLRAGTSQLAPGKFERTLAASDEGGLRVATSVDGTPVGELSVERVGNGFKVAWNARELDEANTFAARLTAEPDLLDAALSDPRVAATVNLGGRGMAVRLRGRERWIVMREDEHPAADLAKGWQARSSHPDADIGMNVKVVDDEALFDGLDGNMTILMLDRSGDRPFFAVGSGGSAGSGGGKIILPGGGEIPVLRGPDRVPRILLADFRRGGSDLGVLAEKLTSEDGVKALAQAAEGHDTGLPQLTSRNGQASIRDLDAGRFDRLARSIAENPRELQAMFREQVLADARTADGLARDGRFEDAIIFLDNSIVRYGPEPDLLLRRDLLLLAKDKPGLVAAQSNGTLPPLRDPDSFFREVRARQADFTGRQADDLELLIKFAQASEGSAGDLGGVGHAGLAYDGGKLQLTYEVKALPQEPVLAVGDMRPGADVYVADHPSLSNIDWSANISQTLPTLLERNDVIVVRLPMGGVDQFHPTVLHVAVKQNAAAHWKGTLHAPSVSRSNSGCDSSQPANCNHDAYVVLPKAA
jgi:hypothetical protein